MERKLVVLWILVGVFVGVCVGQDPVLTPPTLTDAVANTADSDSIITWSPIPADSTNYKANTNNDDSGIQPLYNLAKSFINSALPNGVPYSLIQDYNDQQLSFSKDSILNLMREATGYITAIIIGLLFVLVFPIVGLIFCCCRCCGRCGGKSVQIKPSTPCRRNVYVAVFASLIIFKLVGCICVYVSNDEISSGIEGYGDKFSNDIDDIPTFVNNGFDQMKRVMDTDVSFAVDVLKRDVTNADVLVGIPLREKFRQELNISSYVNQLDAVPTVVNEFNAAKLKLADIQTAYTNFDNEITNWTMGYSTTRTGCPACGSFPDENTLTLNFDPTAIDMTAAEMKINVARDANITGLIQTALDKLNLIPAEVKLNAQDLIVPIDDYKDQITPLIANIDSAKSDALNSVNLPVYKTEVNKYTDLIKPYDEYRWYGGIGIGTIVLFTVLLQFLGLTFGMCGSSATTPPTERGRLSNIGGNMLMASVGFMFIFTALYMLVATITFIVGAPADKALCPSRGGQTSYTQLLQSFNEADPISQLFDGATIDNIFKDCANGKSIYSALNLNQNPDLNISVILNYKDKLDLATNTQNITIDFTSVITSVDDALTEVMNIQTNITTLDFTGIQTELAKDITGTDFNGFLTQLSAKIDGLSTSPTKTTMEGHRDALIVIRDGSFTSLVNIKSNLTTNLDNLTASVTLLKSEVDGLEANLLKSKDFINTNGSAVIKTEVDGFINRLYGVADSLVARATTGLENDIASCRPLYNTFQSLIGDGLCKSLLDAWNGFWFSTGWCIFFSLPSIVFGVKLAKHFRKMKTSYDYEEFPKQKPRKKNNKVFSSDKVRPASQSFSLNMKATPPTPEF